MSNNDVYNNDIISKMPGNNQDPAMYSVIDADSIVDKDSAGQIQAIKLDMTKAQNTFIDLRPVFNANQTDAGTIMPVQPYQWGQAVDLTQDWKGEIHGYYPDQRTTFVLDTVAGNTGTIYNFLWSAGVFQMTGKYTFQFVFTNQKTGQVMSSKWCFFEVEPDVLSMAFNYVDGVSPYDTAYDKWKNKLLQLEDEANTLSKSLTDIKGIAQGYLDNIQGASQNAGAEVAKGLLSDENQWTATQHFSNTTANDMQSGTAEITTLNVSGKVNLPQDQINMGNYMSSQIAWMSTTHYTPTLQNGTASANSSRQYWLWVSKMVPGNVDTPYYILHANLLIDCDDVGKAIATFANWDAGSGNPGTCQSVLGGQIQFHIDSSGNMILESVKGVSGNVWARFTAMM